MKRHAISPRQNWVQKVEEWGLIFHTHEGLPYWDESAYYSFTSPEIDLLESASNELHQMCLKAVDFVIRQNRFQDFAISEDVAQAICNEWESEPPTIYGRFDFGYDGNGAPKLFEYNADTPTSLLEAAVIQWQWLQDVFPDGDQFNSIWEGLIEQWTWLKDNRKLKGSVIHFAAQDHWEDIMTIAALRDTAEQAGLVTEGLSVEQIGWNADSSDFRDLDERRIRTIFKLYPWEFMARDAFAEHALASLEQTQWIEPIWKMVLSNKALLAILWEMYPDHPYLLPAYLDGPRDLERYVVKPILGREGSNVEIVSGPLRRKSAGPYEDEPKVWQSIYDLPNFEGNHPVIGSWIIGEDARGIGIRETSGLITDDLARFVPHSIED